MVVKCGPAPTRLAFLRARIDGAVVRYLTGGAGAPLVFLHGWGVSTKTYRKSLEALADRGYRVYAPTLPGFGGAERLKVGRATLGHYADWVADFIRDVVPAHKSQGVTLVGHSFGGGVAITTAHDHPDLVARLVLVNSIGGSAWTDYRGMARTLRERPLWDWGLHLSADLFPLRQVTRVLPVIIRDAVPNLLRNFPAVWHAGNLARGADLRRELEVLKQRRLPMIIVWSKRDNVIPDAATAALRAASGEATAITVEGTHGWLLYDPNGFGEVITNVIGAASAIAQESDTLIADVGT
ncbi:alpha/beta fold hydrolase [Hoyosella sp. YIM 151337]|uniref:alpha/beta fold hydrolase n=1 Tax=Hoyosella sp. YIM 151337 TaxID=2992742 RepID=UPI0022359B0E|nr:alpha/beta fold hydrolase [Hoyosella sp. YIM 151337]MCW4352929.1 alpha/beta fold hydrolase [Hoyosella sp. YIM 151337]